MATRTLLLVSYTKSLCASCSQRTNISTFLINVEIERMGQGGCIMTSFLSPVVVVTIQALACFALKKGAQGNPQFLKQ